MLKHIKQIIVLQRMINISLPIYYQQTRLKKVMVGMNWLRNAHFQVSNKAKKHYHSLIIYKLQSCNTIIDGEYFIDYRLFYKNKSCDMMNVISVIDKFLNDSLQELGVVQNDNVLFYTGCNVKVAGQDRECPRVEIIISKQPVKLIN